MLCLDWVLCLDFVLCLDWVLCSIGSVSSMACGVYLMVVLKRYDIPKYYDIQGIEEFWLNEDPVSEQFFKQNGTLSTIVLAIVSGGLIGAYAVLVYHICKYFKGQMVLEMTRLSILFAVFCICYVLRAFY